MTAGVLLTNTTPGLIDLGLMFARVFLGACFVVHGLGKLGIVGDGDLAGFADWLKSLGMPAPAVQARMAMVSEIVGGAALATGFMMRPACLLLIFTMAVAGVVGHKGSGYLITNDPPGAEYTINLAALCFVLFLTGPGAISLDAMIF
ncbi:MAG: DoxX family protein [bacterium]|nr:DoxX family protein [bacterium]